jgi:hypothetical protein
MTVLRMIEMSEDNWAPISGLGGKHIFDAFVQAIKGMDFVRKIKDYGYHQLNYNWTRNYGLIEVRCRRNSSLLHVKMVLDKEIPQYTEMPFRFKEYMLFDNFIEEPEYPEYLALDTVIIGFGYNKEGLQDLRSLLKKKGPTR